MPPQEIREALNAHLRKPALLRVCLYEDGTFNAFPWYSGRDRHGDCDYADKPLKPSEAIRFMTGGQVPIEIASMDPNDDRSHNYETLDPKTVTLSYI